MTLDEFLDLVQRRAGLATRGQAQHAAQATLAVLGQRLAGRGAPELAALLPAELAAFLSEPGPDPGLALPDFFERISLRAGCDVPEAVRKTRAVIGVLCETLSLQTYQALLSHLPTGFDTLFECFEVQQST